MNFRIESQFLLFARLIQLHLCSCISTAWLLTAHIVPTSTAAVYQCYTPQPSLHVHHASACPLQAPTSRSHELLCSLDEHRIGRPGLLQRGPRHARLRATAPNAGARRFPDAPLLLTRAAPPELLKQERIGLQRRVCGERIKSPM